MRRLVDLSVLVENSLSEPMKIQVDRLDHFEGAKHFCGEVASRNSAKNPADPRRLQPDDFPDSAFITLDTVTLPTHMGTHIDAPVHYGPNSEGSPARSVDQLPLEWFFGDGVRLDLLRRLWMQLGTNSNLLTLSCSGREQTNCGVSGSTFPMHQG